MSELNLQIGEVRDLPPVIFTSGAAIYDPNPDPTATYYDSAGAATLWALTKLGTGTTTRFYVEDFTQAAGISGVMVYTTTDSAADCKKFGESINVGATWIQRIDAAISTSGATVAAIWNALTSSLTTTGSIGAYLLAKLGLITQGSITYSAPVAPNTGRLTLVQSQDYLLADGGALPAWESQDWAPFDLSNAASVTWSVKTKYSSVVTSGAVNVISDTELDIRTFVRTVTALFVSGTDEYLVQVWAVLDVAHGSAHKLLVNTSMTITNDIRT